PILIARPYGAAFRKTANTRGVAQHGEKGWRTDEVGSYDTHLQRHRSEEHTSELQSQSNLVCRLLLEKKKNKTNKNESIITKILNLYYLNLLPLNSFFFHHPLTNAHPFPRSATYYTPFSDQIMYRYYI